ncbi:MAG TPA: alpha/beta hydrolase [Kofleriaceae bacterium]|jgi:pimeloyl-ACP methyl ester carboxylesterase
MRALVIAAVMATALPAGATPAKKKAPVVVAPVPRWQTLPLPPPMPKATATGTLAHDDAKIYWATYGNEKGKAVVMLHGGLGNSDHWAFQLPALVEKYRVIVVDSRGQGRSTLGTAKLTYHLMGGDVLAVLDSLKVTKASLVGWSDGGAIALDLAVNQPDRVDHMFVIGTNYDSAGSKPRRAQKPSKTFNGYAAKCKTDHLKFGNSLQSWTDLIAALLPVWRNPNGFTKDQIKSIKAKSLVTDGDHDEILERAQIEEMGKIIPNGASKIFDDTSHFAIWQDPETVTKTIVEFLGTD